MFVIFTISAITTYTLRCDNSLLLEKMPVYNLFALEYFIVILSIDENKGNWRG
jgi:hypothetical protein